jgi:hypothetical protein
LLREIRSAQFEPCVKSVIHAGISRKIKHFCPIPTPKLL